MLMSVRLILADQQDLRMPFTDFSSERWDFCVSLISFTSPQHTNDFYDWTEGTGPLLRGVRSQERVFQGPALGVVPRFHPASCTLSI